MPEIVVMLVDTQGSPNGLDVYSYKKGEKYAVGTTKMSESLALQFVENKDAKMSEEREAPTEEQPKGREPGPTETKKDTGSIEQKKDVPGQRH